MRICSPEASVVGGNQGNGLRGVRLFNFKKAYYYYFRKRLRRIVVPHRLLRSATKLALCFFQALGLLLSSRESPGFFPLMRPNPLYSFEQLSARSKSK